jgi:endonuclease-3
MNKINNILDYLEELYPNSSCELIYNHDYELVIAVVLSAQTTDKKVNKVTPILFSKYPSLTALKEAPIDEIIDIIKQLGMYHKKAYFIHEIASTLHDIYHDKVPSVSEDLENIKGIGRKTANVILGILFNEPIIAVDTHVSRVSKRLCLANNKDNVLRVEKKLYKLIPKDNLINNHYRLVLFGRYHCKAVKPNCINCKLKDICREKEKEYS